MRSATGIAIATLMLAVLACPARVYAYDLSGVGAKIEYLDPDSGSPTVTVGGHLEFEGSHTRLHLLPNVMWWQSDGVTDVNPNFDVYYHFLPEGQVTPYIGGGVGLHAYSYNVPVFVRDGTVIERHDSNTDLGANLITGIRFPMPHAHLFLEGRYVITDDSQVAASGGVTFHVR